MRTVLVTGGTGLIGSNICQQLLEQGDEVRVLARAGSETGPLEKLGARIVAGDITDPRSVRDAAEGCDAAIHSAAVLGGVSQDRGEHERVNTGGIANVLDAAEAHGFRRVVALGTTTYFDFTDQPLSEASPVDPNAADDPYTQTKRAAFLEAMRRAEAGLDLCVVIPGGTYGPAPTIHRSIEAPSYNLRIMLALRGEIEAIVQFPIPWSLASDVASVAVKALDKGVSGEKYLAFGPAEEVSSMADFLNMACELAGVKHRVRQITAADLDADPALVAQAGPSLVALAHHKFPQPYFTNEVTRQRLGFEPVPLAKGLQSTLDWLRANKLTDR